LIEIKDFLRNVLKEFCSIIYAGKMDAPVFTRPLSDRECREGRPVKFECAVKGIPRPDIKWLVLFYFMSSFNIKS